MPLLCGVERQQHISNPETHKTMERSAALKYTSTLDPIKGFRIHLLVCALATPVIWAVWFLTDRTYPWPLWSTPTWALGVLFHYLGLRYARKYRSNN